MTRMKRLALCLALALPSTAPALAQPKPTPITSAQKPYPTVGSVESLDPAFEKLVDKDAKLEKLANGFKWAEGPIWVKKGAYLLFTDVPNDTIYKWKDGEGVSVFMRPAGYHGDRTDIREPGANGLTLDAKGRLLMCQHGDRRVARLDDWKQPNGAQTALAERYDGKRLNSPNDLVVHRSGDVFFTDPPYGLPTQSETDKEKELAFQGVYRVDGKGKVTLLSDVLERPNGIAFSPDQKTLYVANSHGPRPIWMAFPVKPDRSLGEGRVLFDATELVKRTGRKGGNDGIAVDKSGNLFATGPGGVLVFSPDGKHLGTILTGVPTANCKFGEDGRTLFITANDMLLRVRTKTRGLGF